VDSEVEIEEFIHHLELDFFLQEWSSN
jgi:hypothetical protein